jgi:hypothetical protein
LESRMKTPTCHNSKGESNNGTIVKGTRLMWVPSWCFIPIMELTIHTGKMMNSTFNYATM